MFLSFLSPPHSWLKTAERVGMEAKIRNLAKKDAKKRHIPVARLWSWAWSQLLPTVVCRSHECVVVPSNLLSSHV